LSIRQVPIDAGSVTLGMYVSKLDRPWLETPFIFQGFEVKERAEIDTLQRYCNTVYIDVDRGDLSPAQVRRLLQGRQVTSGRSPAELRRRGKQAGPFMRWLQRLLLRLGMHRQSLAIAAAETDEVYKIESTVRGEARAAKNAYLQLAHHHGKMMDRATLKCDVHVGALRRAVQPAIDSILRNPSALAWTVFSRKRSPGEYNRAVGTAIWCLMFGRQLGLDRAQLEDLAMGAMLLDIGNARIPKSIVEAPGVLSLEQYDALRRHVALGMEILASSKGITQNVADMVRCHQERADGSGYPDGLVGNRIPAFARIAGIADCYDAMTTESPHSKAMAAYDAARELNDMRGNEFAAEVVEQFLATIGMFPVASTVELNNGSIAVVLEQNPHNVLKPKLMVLLDRNKQPLPQPKILEMRDLPADVTHSNALWIVQGHEHGAFGVEPMRIFG
jgi:HD-GYP domain-containing protein (c-di-GMP phosphodiesterase class II)